jgi:hypothetical protein
MSIHFHVAAQHRQDNAMKILLDHHADVTFAMRFFIVFLPLVFCYYVCGIWTSTQSCDHLEFKFVFYV